MAAPISIAVIDTNNDAQHDVVSITELIISGQQTSVPSLRELAMQGPSKAHLETALRQAAQWIVNALWASYLPDTEISWNVQEKWYPHVERGHISPFNSTNLPFMNGDGNAETEHDAVEITQQLINGQQPNIPTILQLSEADTPPQNAVDALQQTSGWIIERVGEHSTQLAIELLVKWGPLHDDESDWAEFAQLPTWNLRILVKDCWKDAQIVQNGEHH